MTPKEQRIAIAEACGWTATVDDDQFWRATRADGSMTSDLWCSMSSVWNVGIPDYLNDLNDMHDAEKVLTDEIENNEFERYCKKLSELCCPIKCGGSGCGFTITATASQRAEAFLRTIGKWMECK
jgi:hypothetical protein